MRSCKNCGVELDVEMNFCPLCGQKSNSMFAVDQSKHSINTEHAEEIVPYSLNELTHVQKRKLFWELSIIIVVSGVLVSFIIDLITNQQITWSKFTISAGLFVSVNIWLIMFLQRKFIVLLLGSFVTSSVLLVVLDLFNNNMGWGLKLGIPIIFFFYVIVFLLAIAVKTARQKGINVVAYILMAIGILSVCVESIISLHVHNVIKLQWSLILLVSILSVSGILLFIHYRLKKATDLKRFFHI